MLTRARRVHAEMALLAADAAVFDDCEYWRGVGMRSCAEWISKRLGFSRHDADALLLAGHTVRELPRIREAFCAGEISLDKARMLAPVVPPEDDAVWAERARKSTPGQLARRCRQERKSKLASDPERDRDERAERNLTMWWDERSSPIRRMRWSPSASPVPPVSAVSAGRRRCSRSSTSTWVSSPGRPPTVLDSAAFLIRHHSPPQTNV